MADHGVTDEIGITTRMRAVRAAQGLEPFDLLLRGGTIVDVITGECRSGDIGIVGKMIASVHSNDSLNNALAVHDVHGMWLAPGLIDTHVHFESSHMLPHHYASVVVPQGTTTIFFDPHELANVLGVPGVRYAVEATRNLPLRCFCQAPSSVPSAPGLELSGASFGGVEMRQMLSWPEVIGVAEMMDMNGVLASSERMVAIAEEGRRQEKLLEGHARGLTGPKLQGYAAAGIWSDHEITSGEDFLEKLRAGLAIELRGSHDEVIPDVVSALKSLPRVPSQIMFCTDDVPPDTLLKKGGVIDVLRRFVLRGMDPVDALSCATWNAAVHLKRPDLGALCPGKIADIVVFSDLKQLAVRDVYVSGVLSARAGEMLTSVTPYRGELPASTMKCPRFSPRDFRIRVPEHSGHTVRMRTIKGVRFSEWSEASFAVRDGYVALPADAEMNFIFSYHRHGTYAAQPQVAVQEGIATLHGAIATTYEHDSHNLYAIGGNAEDMALAANVLVDCGGGIAVAQNGQLIGLIEYPIAGMLSPEPPQEVARLFQEVRSAAERVTGWKRPHWSFKTLEGLSLACNPFPYLTDVGLVDGKTGEVMEMFLPVGAKVSS